MGLIDRFRQLSTYGMRAVRSRNVLLYMGFVGIAAVFWCFMTFNKTVQQEIAIKVVIDNKPDGVTFIDDVPSTIIVTVKDRGTAFLKMKFRDDPVLHLDYTRYSDDEGHFAVSADKLMSEVKGLFRQEASLVRITPESIVSSYTLMPGKRVPVSYMGEINVQPDEQHSIYGDIDVTPDSVTIYGDLSKIAQVTEVKIAHVDAPNLNATLERDVVLVSVPGVRIEPRKVHLKVPIEALIRKQQVIPVEVRNAPPGTSVILFPASVEASFLLPQSLYKHPTGHIVAVVDYNDISGNPQASKVHVNVGERPPYYHNIKLATDSVEFIIEHDFSNAGSSTAQ